MATPSPGRAPVPQPVKLLKVPSRIQFQPQGTANPNSGGRSQPAPSIQLQGPSQAKEQFSAGPNIHPDVARALNQLQSNIQQSTQQAKSSPTANCNLLQGVTMVQGMDSGASPYTIIPHSLGLAYSSVQFHANRNGQYNAGPVVIPATAEYPATSYVLVWSQFTVWDDTQPFTQDILVYA